MKGLDLWGGMRNVKHLHSDTCSLASEREEGRKKRTTGHFQEDKFGHEVLCCWSLQYYCLFPDNSAVRAPHTPAEGIQLDACTCCIYCYYRETRKKTRKTTVWKNGLASSKKDQNYFASCEEKLLLFCSSKDNFLYSLSTMLP